MPVLFCRYQGSKDKESPFLQALVHLCPLKYTKEAKEHVSDTIQARTLKRTCTSPNRSSLGAVSRGAAPRSWLKDNCIIPAFSTCAPGAARQKSAHRKETQYNSEFSHTSISDLIKATALSHSHFPGAVHRISVQFTATLRRRQDYRDQSWQHHGCSQQC